MNGNCPYLIAWLLLLTTTLCQQRVIFFHDGSTPNYPKSMNLSNLRNSPSYVTYNCSSYDCNKMIKTDYPSLYYWKGPGSAFERIDPPTEENVRAHLQAKEVGVINQLRNHLEQITLLHMFVYANLLAFGLYSCFSKLFAPPQHKHTRHGTHNTHGKKQ